MERRPYRVALTGARTDLGELLIAALEDDPDCEHIAALDIRPPESGRLKTRFVRLDLTHPTADALVAQVLRDDGIDVLCHLAFLSNPSHSSSWAHELEAIGTLYVMNAAAEARVHKIVLASTTMAYGADPMNPAFLSEGHRLRGDRRSRWVSDKVAAERELTRLAKDCPHVLCTTLRYCITLGPSLHNWWTRVLSRQAVARVMGYDPLMQFIHEEDALAALLLAVREDHPGVFNIVGEGSLYFSDVLKLGGKLPIPVPHLLGYPIGNALFSLELADAPGTFLNFIRYSWVADDRRMREVMGFSPRWSSKDALVDFYEAVAARRAGKLPEPRPPTTRPPSFEGAV